MAKAKRKKLWRFPFHGIAVIDFETMEITVTGKFELNEFDRAQKKAAEQHRKEMAKSNG